MRPRFFKRGIMKTGFKDPSAPKVKEESKKSPWNFDQPPYDERSSCYVNAGSHWGVGHRQPMGSLKHTSAGPIPFGRVKTMKDDEVPHKNLRLEIDV